MENDKKLRNIVKNTLCKFLLERQIHSDEYINEIFKQLGYKNIKNVGGGYFGQCFELDSKLIGKVTTDPNEKHFVKKLINKNNNYLINYYDVFEFSEFDIIIMEKVDTNHIDKKKLNKAKRLLEKIYGSYDFIEKIYNISKFIVLSLNNSYLIDMVKILIEGYKFGIVLDLRGDNFGIKNNHLCSFDFMVTKDINFNYIIRNLKYMEDNIDKNIIKYHKNFNHLNK